MASREAKGTTKGRVRQTGVNLMTTHPTDIPQSAFRDPQSRHALTLAEVLIAMGIMTIGLLGVASVFPVGGHYIQTGDVADRAGAVAQAALEDAVVQGHLDPENWVVLDFDALDGASALRNPQGQAGPNAVWFDYLAKSIREASAAFTPGTDRIAGSTAKQFNDRMYGGAFVIDSVGMAAAINETTAPNSQNVIQAFLRPGNGVDSRAARRFPATRSIAYYRQEWRPWTLGPVDGARPDDQMWPIRRVTVSLKPPAAFRLPDRAFASPAARWASTSPDDLALKLGGAGDAPAKSVWRTSSSQPAARTSSQEYSWLLSISPPSSAARDALATRPDSYPYEVSAVVFHKRVVVPGHAGALESERLVHARLTNVTPGGGELLLEKRSHDAVATDPFENLRSGEFVMLTGPHPLSTDDNPRLVVQWHRVLRLEREGTVEVGPTNEAVRLGKQPSFSNPNVSVDRVLVALRGPDIPWTPSAIGANAAPTQLSNDLRVAIVPGAVAVHTKTMRLEAGSEWSVD